MKKTTIIVTIFLLFFFLLSCHSGRKKIMKDSVRHAMLERLYQALFVYYIDNGRFPTEKEGLVYALYKTGKKFPYINVGKLFSMGSSWQKNRIIRKSGLSLKSKDKILKGDMFLDPYDKAIFYKLSSDKKKFDLADLSNLSRVTPSGLKKITIEEWYNFRYNKILWFKNLPYLRYKKIFDGIGKPISYCITFQYLEFYLEKKIKNKKKKGKQIKQKTNIKNSKKEVPNPKSNKLQ